MRTLAFTFCLFYAVNLTGQQVSNDIANQINDSILEIKSLNTLDAALYERFKQFDIVLVGEMHGTMEPARFVEALAELMAAAEGGVQVGVEIPASELKLFTEHPNDSTLRHSRYFSAPNMYGKNSIAWFELIQHCSKNDKIKLFYFDNEKSDAAKRDHTMYTAVLEQKMLQPGVKIIILSGNVHNRLIPFRGEATMGSFIAGDTLNFNRNRICSINHAFTEGTLLNNTGKGLKLTTYPYNPSVYSGIISYDKYLWFYKPADEYNCVLYTREVHHAESLK